MRAVVSFAIFWASLSVVAVDLLNPYALLDQQFPSCDKVGIEVLSVCRPELFPFDRFL